MKTEFLQELGLEKEAIDKIMAENGKDIAAEKGKTRKAAEERDAFQQQLSDVQESLKKFEGVDVDGLKGQIKTLTEKMATAEADYQQKIAERDFFSMLDTKILAMGGKSTKGIKAELDLEALRASKNQEADAEAALKALGETHAYYFNQPEAKAPEPPKTPAKVSTGGTHGDGGTTLTSSDQMNAIITGKWRGA